MSIRAFIAIPLPSKVKLAIRSLGEQLVEKGLRLRLVRPEGIHCTLRFLGNIEESQVNPIGQAMERASQGIQVATMNTKGIGVFPNPARTRVLWVGIGGETGPVTTLHERLQGELRVLGFEPEKRGFSPHLTVGRWRSPLGRAERELLREALEEHSCWSGGEFDLKEVVLYQSTLHPSGARYTPLKKVTVGEER